MAQRGRPRKYPLPEAGDTSVDAADRGSVTVQMTDDPDELDSLLAAATAPRRPVREDNVRDDPDADPDPNAPPHRQPESPDLPDPAAPNPAPNNNEEADDWEDRPADPPAAAGANHRSDAVRSDAVTGTLDQPDGDVAEVSQRPRDPRSRASQLIEGEIIPTQKRYESRITIVDAWQYPGTLSQAPDWIDRNWAAWADYDQIRGMEPGPALRVPTHGEGYRETLCRVGDFVARQEVKLLADIPGEIKLEVWEKEQFERLFMPSTPIPIEAHAA